MEGVREAGFVALDLPNRSLVLQEPRRVSGKYVAGDGSGEDQPKAFVSINWVLTEEPLDVESELALGFLDYLLLGTSASPLRKVLLIDLPPPPVHPTIIL